MAAKVKEILNVTQQTLRNYIIQGKLQPLKSGDVDCTNIRKARSIRYWM